MEVCLGSNPFAPSSRSPDLVGKRSSVNEVVRNYVLGCALGIPMRDGFLWIPTIHSARVTSVASVPYHPYSSRGDAMLLLEPGFHGPTESAARTQADIARPQPAGDVVSAQADEFLEEVARLDHSESTCEQLNECPVGSSAPVHSDTVTQFLSKFVELQASHGEDQMIDSVLESLNKLLKAGEFGQCDRILAGSVSLIPSMPAGVIASFLGITWRAKDRLPARATFYEEAESFVTKTRGADESHRLLHWFK